MTATNERVRYNTVLTNVGGGYMTKQDELFVPFQVTFLCYFIDISILFTDNYILI